MLLAIEASEAIATRFVDAVEACFEPLRYFPRSGSAGDALAPGLRVVFHAPYAIYHVQRGDVIVIVRVIHGARDIAALAARGEFY